MLRKDLVSALAAVMTLLSVPLGAGLAQTLYGITWGSQLITVNTTTGATTVVGPTSLTIPLGLGFRGNKLYAYDHLTTQLHELNPATGAIVTNINIGAPGNYEGDLTFRSDGMGFLTVGTAFGFPSGGLFRVDITVPNSTFVGPMSQLIDGLAFNAAGVLYGLNELSSSLFTIDPTTAAVTLVGNTGITVGGQLGGLAFDSAGNLFAVSGDIVTIPGVLYRINPSTGVGTVIGPLGRDDVAGIAFQPVFAPPGVTVVQSGGTTNVAEGGTTDSYTVALNTSPTANVGITINPGMQLSVVPTTLTFTPVNWNNPQTVTVLAIDDPVMEGAHTGTITHSAASTDSSYNGIAIASITAAITDNDSGPTGGGGPGGPEGSFDGSGRGPRNEGGFGGRTSLGIPVLWGPVLDAAAVPRLRVYNVSYRSGKTPSITENAKREIAGGDLFDWALFSALAIALGCVLIRNVKH